MWLVHVYWWLEDNNLWKSVLSWAVFTTLTGAAAWLPWKRHRQSQKQIADQLDTSTPGGLTDVVKAIKEVQGNEDHR